MSINDQKLEWVCRIHDGDCKWIYNIHDNFYVHRAKILKKVSVDLDQFSDDSYIDNSYIYEKFTHPPLSNFYDSTIADIQSFGVAAINTITDMRKRKLKFYDGKFSSILKYGLVVLSNFEVALINKHKFTQIKSKSINKDNEYILSQKVYIKTVKDYITTVFKYVDNKQTVTCGGNCKIRKYICPNWVHNLLCGESTEELTNKEENEFD